jgi:leucine-zipper of insertion element IS481
MTHRNAPLTPEGRRRLIERCRTRPVAHVAAEMGISRATASKWVNRYDHSMSTSRSTDKIPMSSPSLGPTRSNFRHRTTIAWPGQAVNGVRTGASTACWRKAS